MIDAFAHVVKLLAGRDKTEQQLRVALEKKQFTATVIDDAITRAKQLGYLDETRAAKVMAIAERNKGASIDGAVAKLMTKGLSATIARAAVSQAWTEVNATDESSARALLAKRKLTGLKAARFLASRGFDEGLIARLVDLPRDLME